MIAKFMSLVNTAINWVAHMRDMIWTHISGMTMRILIAVGTWELSMIAKFVSLVSGLWNAITGFPGKVQSWVTNFANNIKNGIMALVTAAPGWMGQMVQGMINGLMGGLGNLKNAVGNIASAIMGPLAHASPAKEGPLANDDQWMPNMMRMHAKGITDNIPLLKAAMNQAGLGINTPGINGLNTPTANAMSAARMAQSGGDTIINIPLSVDSKLVASAVYKQSTGQLQLNGYSRLAR